jgi:hypothetical protein
MLLDAIYLLSISLLSYYMSSSCVEVAVFRSLTVGFLMCTRIPPFTKGNKAEHSMPNHIVLQELTLTLYKLVTSRKNSECKYSPQITGTTGTIRLPPNLGHAPSPPPQDQLDNKTPIHAYTSIRDVFQCTLSTLHPHRVPSSAAEMPLANSLPHTEYGEDERLTSCMSCNGGILLLTRALYEVAI